MNAEKTNILNILEARIDSTDSVAKLEILASNIVKKAGADSAFAQLAERARSKASALKYAAKFHIPATSLFEQVAKAFTIQGAVVMENTVSARCLQGIKSAGYVGFHIRNVQRGMCHQNYQTLKIMGLVILSSEYFVYRYCQHLVSPQLLSKLASLFKTHPFTTHPAL